MSVLQLEGTMGKYKCAAGKEKRRISFELRKNTLIVLTQHESRTAGKRKKISSNTFTQKTSNVLQKCLKVLLKSTPRPTKVPQCVEKIICSSF